MMIFSAKGNCVITAARIMPTTAPMPEAAEEFDQRVRGAGRSAGNR